MRRPKRSLGDGGFRGTARCCAGTTMQLAHRLSARQRQLYLVQPEAQDLHEERDALHGAPTLRLLHDVPRRPDLCTNRAPDTLSSMTRLRPCVSDSRGTRGQQTHLSSRRPNVGSGAFRGKATGAAEVRSHRGAISGVLERLRRTSSTRPSSFARRTSASSSSTTCAAATV